jgi:hypothetical protein
LVFLNDVAAVPTLESFKEKSPKSGREKKNTIPLFVSAIAASG